MSYTSPTFIKFILSATDPEDTDFTMISKGVFTTLELLTAQKNQLAIQTFSSNSALIE